MEEEDEEEEEDDEAGELPSAPEMKQELIMAIRDEMDEYQTLKRENDDLQRKIFFMDNNQRDFDKGSE